MFNKYLKGILVAAGLFFTVNPTQLIPPTAKAASISQSVINNPIPDLSEWQGALTDSQVKKLKATVPFVILRVQYGSSYRDKYFDQNAALCRKYGLKYGVYSYSLYTNAATARTEAKNLYNRGVGASFYVNDYEQQTVTSGSTETATNAWYQQMRQLAPNRRILFYSYLSFAQTYAPTSMLKYDGYWLANYTSVKPTGTYALWQFTDSWYSSALNQKIDASQKNLKTNSWFLSSRAIKYDKVVGPQNKSYRIWRNLDFTASNGSTKLDSNQAYEARNYYEHYDGAKYYSLYKNNRFVGYVNVNAMQTLKATKTDLTVKINKANQSIWGNLFFTKVRAKTVGNDDKTYTVKNLYHHPNGKTYYSLYHDGKWQGYINKDAVTIEGGA
ncbi:GH25 family lysozyme [Lactobacillus sp. Sy-1]|uniref:GH25 family lysozyme n=1 Tax=Lactobacillus sp. Sy-1 TaxID=2109645 RepID=UPI001C5A630A|nr:GH25 family lysozyme [Lactobacillus sp. Sy-1]MBW1606357.1 hypothetical protein [Lactobacillus sp. Sy-1]